MLYVPVLFLPAYLNLHIGYNRNRHLVYKLSRGVRHDVKGHWRNVARKICDDKARPFLSCNASGRSYISKLLDPYKRNLNESVAYFTRFELPIISKSERFPGNGSTGPFMLVNKHKKPAQNTSFPPKILHFFLLSSDI